VSVLAGRAARFLAAGLLLLGCSSLGGVGERVNAGSDEEALYYGYYRPDRRDYASFRQAHSEILEPNYLPYMLHRLPGDEVRGDDLVFCRWPDDKMPLAVMIEPPTIPDSLQNEFDPHQPSEYIDAVARALDSWEEALEGHVRFRRVEQGGGADLRLRILGQRAPTPNPEVQVLGATEGIRGSCLARGWDRHSDRMRVHFEVSELVLYIADRYGLLTPDQVRRAAMHEVGHALGMSGHSPLSTDLMFRILGEDRRMEALSIQDVNSFLSLYQLPSGSHYGRTSVQEPPPRPPPAPPSGPPQLSTGPHVDARIGFALNTPSRWIRAETPHGFFAASGPFWDYDASMELFVWPSATIEDFLERFGQAFFQAGWVRHRGWMVIHGNRSLRVALEEEDGRSAEFTIIELGDGRVMMLLAHCPTEYRAEWEPWFRAVLSSLQIWE